ncbi:MAG TPA: FAD-dependent oxidoreductase [Pyrinomonadaceae bacterium]|nr:FAD-dependent oxidoreductase [Pyrinomonadaceae bacterium]
MAAAYDVVVVGAGIGGLTAGALLAARGMNVCVLERQSQVGGCIARVEFAGHEFEPGMGIYTGFGEGEIYARVFDELPVEVPRASLVSRPCVVRLADGTDVRLTGDDGFFDELSAAFPECADHAIEFYSKSRPEDFNITPVNLNATSHRFQSFIDTQLRGFLHASIDQCSSAAAAAALARARGPLYEIQGGPATLAERLAESIKRSGGTVRLNTPVLRLAYDSNGTAVGVDLLNGEQVFARKAIVSNLTIWDTYGKLVGLNRTPAEIKKLLNTLHGSGAYVVYTTIEEAAISRLPSERLLVATRSAIPQQSDAKPDSHAGPDSVAEPDDLFTEITLAVHGRTATLQSATDVNDWFTYHASEEDFEDSDQAALEHFWTKLHAALPELGGDIEVIETANPRTWYENTRRKLGMVLGNKPAMVLGLQSNEIQAPSTRATISPAAILPNLFMVGDTVISSPDLATVAEAALSLANHL